jgi:IclR family acetate operon transcriptional repressor
VEQELSSKVQLVDRTLAILRLFSGPHAAWSLAEITGAVGLPKATVHRLLQALCKHEMLRRSPYNGSYGLGTLSFTLGCRAVGQNSLRALGTPVLRQLATDAGETALMFQLSDARDRAICVEQIEFGGGLRLVSNVGASFPLIAGGSSRAILAYMPAEEIAGILAGAEGPKLRDQIAATRRDGFAQSFEETNLGACGIAAPLFDALGAVIGSISLVGPTVRLDAPRLAALAPRLLESAAEINRLLGAATPESKSPRTRQNGTSAQREHPPSVRTLR